MKTGKLLALDDLMAKSGVNKTASCPRSSNAFSYNGKVYGIRRTSTPRGSSNNKDLFKAAGVAEPTNDWTWTDPADRREELTSAASSG